ncbi:uncharacterized protein IAS62_006302 [Cryptococcus decagattii]|uniref:Uncharacterized protein n=1 Tax=Cryptococcus decagattii TaxID=1859122 RepID=A0ABZ2B296_9TREE
MVQVDYPTAQSLVACFGSVSRTSQFFSPNRHLCYLFLLLRWPANRQTEKAAVAVSSKGGETEEYHKEASTLPIAALF